MEIKVYNSYMYGLLQAVENLKQCLDSIKAAEDEGKRFIDLSYASCYPDRYARINVCFRMEAERLEDFVNRAYNKISSLLDQPLTKEEQEFIFNSYLTDDFCEIKPIWLSTCYMPGGYPHSSILLQCRSDERFYLTRIIGYKKPDEEKYCTFWTNTKKHWYPTEAYRATERCLYYDKYKADEIRKTALHHSDLLYKVRVLENQIEQSDKISLPYQVFNGIKYELRIYTVPSKLFRDLVNETYVQLKNINYFSKFVVYRDVFLSDIRYEWDYSVELETFIVNYASNIPIKLPENQYFSVEKVDIMW